MTTLAMISTAIAVWTALGPPSPTERLVAAGLTTKRQQRQSRWPGATALPRARTWLDALYARRRSVALWRSAVIELCDGIAAELNSGRAPEVAFARTIAVLDPPTADAFLAEWCERTPTEIDVTLDRLSARPGAEGLRMLAACWRIGVDRGGTFASVVEGIAVALRDEDAQRQEVAAQLAGPRATARLLAGLPLIGLGMAAALGANPLTFLFGTIPGLACLTLGVGLDLLGLWWTHRLAKTAESPR